MSVREPCLRLDDRFTHLVWVDASVVLVGDQDAVLLESAAVADVVRQVNGRATAVDIAETLCDVHPPELVHFILMQLEHGAILRSAGSVDGDVEAADPVDGAATPAPYGVAELANRLRQAWTQRSGAGIVPVHLPVPQREAPLLLLVEDYLDPRMPPAATDEMRTTPFLLASVGVRRVWVGPAILPGASPCVQCLQERLRLNLAARALLHASATSASAPSRIERLDSVLPPASWLALSGTLLGRLESDGPAGFRDSLHVVDVRTAGVETHPVVRLPQCASCGNPSLHPPGAAVTLQSRPHTPGSGGGYRSARPEETLARLQPLISPLTGAVRRVRRLSVEDAPFVHVYTAAHAYHYGVATLGAVRANRRDASGGKGRSDIDARVGAVCEALERFSAVHRGTEPLREARLSELADDAIAPADLLGFSTAQYERREDWNRQDAGGLHWIPQLYQDEPIGWTEVRSLRTGDARLVPGAAVYLGFRGPGNQFCRADSNGLAAGNCIEEAILQGFLELVERDAIALWWYNRVDRPGVELGSSQDPWVDQVRQYYHRLGRELWMLDLTTDLGIPCFAGVSACMRGPAPDVIFGFGAHLDANLAFARALAELNQLLPTVLLPLDERRNRLLPEFASAIDWWENATLPDHPYLRPAPHLPARALDVFPPPATTDLLEDVAECVRRAERVGCDVLVHDLTRPDVDLAVVRVFVPGLRHFWRRLGPGRLYDAPVRLGWLAEPRPEDEMNPVSMFV